MGSEKSERDISENLKRVWVKEGEIIKPTMVITGMTDGINLEVISGLNEGDEIVISMDVGSNTLDEKEDDEETQKSPFVQERPGKPGGGPGR